MKKFTTRDTLNDLHSNFQEFFTLDNNSDEDLKLDLLSIISKHKKIRRQQSSKISKLIEKMEEDLNNYKGKPYLKSNFDKQVDITWSEKSYQKVVVSKVYNKEELFLSRVEVAII